MAESKKTVQLLMTKVVQLKEKYRKQGLDDIAIDRELGEHLLKLQQLPGRETDKMARSPGIGTANTGITSMPLFVPVAIAMSVCICCVVFPDILEFTGLRQQPCLVENNMAFEEISRPVFDCDVCRHMTRVPDVAQITPQQFETIYAYTGVPVLIKNATQEWKAMGTFSFQYLKQLYQETEGALEAVEEECQFFPYNTEFKSLSEAFNMSDRRAAYNDDELPWYFGWSNCNQEVAAELRKHYQRPHFLPKDSESSSIDWLFMGGQGDGAHMHLDQVDRPSWQAQIHGTKTWTLIPSPECEHICHQLEVTVDKGDIIILDTNQWYHSTFIHPGEISITIGSEYD